LNNVSRGTECATRLNTDAVLAGTEDIARLWSGATDNVVRCANKYAIEDRQPSRAGGVDPDVVSLDLISITAETKNGNAVKISRGNHIATVWCRAANNIVWGANGNSISSAIRARAARSICADVAPLNLIAAPRLYPYATILKVIEYQTSNRSISGCDVQHAAIG